MAQDANWMAEALTEADAAAAEGEVPVGCVIVDSAGVELARARNARESRSDPTAHAEVMAIRAAAQRAEGWRLEGATVYVTLEPCPMCAGALVLARVSRVVFGCSDPKSGAVTTLFGIGRDPRLNHRFEVTEGIRGEECSRRLRDFFALLRAESKGKGAPEAIVTPDRADGGHGDSSGASLAGTPRSSSDCPSS
jgi:tRNA(adenine34) deaminase